jgi:hypothetical protein
VEPTGRSTSRKGGSAGDWTAPPPWGSVAGPAAVGPAAGAPGVVPPGFGGSAAPGPGDLADAVDSEPADGGIGPAEIARSAERAPGRVAHRRSRTTPRHSWLAVRRARLRPPPGTTTTSRGARRMTPTWISARASPPAARWRHRVACRWATPRSPPPGASVARAAPGVAASIPRRPAGSSRVDSRSTPPSGRGVARGSPGW